MSKQPIPIITQSEALDWFRYDPESGELKWRVTMGPRAIAGAVAGSISANSYRRVMVNKRFYYAHRIIWLMKTGKWPDQIDHINHNGADNRWCNLRAANQLANSKNCHLSFNNTSGQTGVCWNSASGKWSAQIQVQWKAHHLGRFVRFDDAVAARKAAERKYGFHPNHGIQGSIAL